MCPFYAFNNVQCFKKLKITLEAICVLNRFSQSTANLFEGDLKLSKEEIDTLDQLTVSKKDVIADERRKWPNGRVPIVLDANFGT